MDASTRLANTLREFRRTHAVQFLQVGTDRWEYVTGGTGDGAILLVGGGGSTSESMFSVNLALEPSCRVVSVSLPTTASSVEQIAQGIRAILDLHNMGQATLLGHSLGGMVAQSFAVKHPERVAGLVLSNTGFYLGVRATLLPAASLCMARIPESWLMRMVISQLSRLLKPAEGAGFWLEFYREELSQPGAGARIKHQLGLIAKYARFFRDSMLRSELPWTEALPVQIVTSEDDRGFSKRETAFLSSLYPNSQRLTLPKGSGHLTFLTRPDAYVGAVQKFLAGVAADSIFRDSAPVTH